MSDDYRETGQTEMEAERYEAVDRAVRATGEIIVRAGTVDILNGRENHDCP